MNFIPLRRFFALSAGAFLCAGILPGASPFANEGLQLGAAGWSQLSIVGHSSDTAEAADHNGKSMLSWGAQLTLRSQISDQLDISAGVGLAAGHSMRSMPGEPTGYAPLGVGAFVSEAQFTYRFRETESTDLFVRGGLFPYMYNPDVKNLGLYLLRGPVYPGFVISGFETKHVLPVANMLGLQLHHRMGNFRQDLILNSDMDFYPYFDISPAYVAGYQVHPSLDIGAGVNLYHYIPVDRKLTTDRTYVFVTRDTAGTPQDTIQISFRGIKLMARAAFDPKVFFASDLFGEEDLKLYGEIALIGLDDTEAHNEMYGDLTRRMPVMAGFNLPAFGWLDHLSLEVQWYGAPFHDNMEPYLTGYNKPSPYPVGWQNSTNTNDIKNVTDDNWKWSLHGAKVIQNHVRISVQVANDHWRPGIYRGDGDTNLPKRQAIMVSPKDWYFSSKLAYFF